ncbi:hypothetical protein [uncultured Ruegeria sp.]|uniref:hypothetical protein n=1 Tax=uncultured Ruegeria sp. TaxID=259304 RepID=UPI00261A05C6|nr:hypothetical protein [uncultured Ruegeria sp.]
MAKKRQMDGAPGKRAGLPLARANRLAETAEAKRGRAPSMIVATGLLTVAAIVSVGVMPANTALSTAFDALHGEAVSTSLETPKRPKQRPHNTVENTPLNPETVTETAATPSATDMDLLPDVIAKTEPPAQPVLEEPVQVVASINPAAPYCIQMIQSRVAALHYVTQTASDWDSRQQDVSRLVQSTLDCSQAGLQIAGSLELAGTGIADLRVRWNLETWTLHLAVVDSAYSESGVQLAGVSDQSIEFVVQ